MVSLRFYPCSEYIPGTRQQNHNHYYLPWEHRVSFHHIQHMKFFPCSHRRQNLTIIKERLSGTQLIQQTQPTLHWCHNFLWDSSTTNALLFPSYQYNASASTTPSVFSAIMLLHLPLPFPCPVYNRCRTDKVKLNGSWWSKSNRAFLLTVPFKPFTVLEDKAVALDGDFCNQVPSSFCCPSWRGKHFCHRGQHELTWRCKMHYMQCPVISK